MEKSGILETLMPEVLENLSKAFGDHLESLVLYGSAATGDYRPGKSDINLLAVLSGAGTALLDRALPLVKSWRKKRLAVPLFLTEEEIRSSLDVFPLEFLTMRRHHVLVAGRDVLGGLAFRKEDVRSQCERDLRGKLILLRTGFLDSEGREKDLRNLMGESITAFLSLFQGLLFLKDLQIPPTKREILEKTAEALSLKGEVFSRCLDIREGKGLPAGENVREVFMGYMKEIEALCIRLDTLQCP
ncbi:MAG TPA: nucleotidyltransferase domain-containing protein [Syntrophales bacterium]|nr:nucleotidyltransferase domain-containing protein [Syntrophales bacterium]HPX10823.1 nucleotidyltransferase domain-containing protein [Syntrophales bacterium]HQB30949.1 nucleotidyltransferase domain-containing protein [Syntrophales bacterium]HQN79294.1 nucleotidyltransferase domain-containing protein [Syntrophales bacterium]HQQ28130.1 nucleotidyltransferase domain-containing protein [Syntrophales bacterium]